MIVLEGRWTDAGYFLTISQRSKMTVNLVQLSERGKNEDPSAPILRTMEQIENLEAEVILLYTNKGNIELMLQQVVYLFSLPGHVPSIFCFVISKKIVSEQISQWLRKYRFRICFIAEIL